MPVALTNDNNIPLDAGYDRNESTSIDDKYEGFATTNQMFASSQQSQGARRGSEEKEDDSTEESVSENEVRAIGDQRLVVPKKRLPWCQLKVSRMIGVHPKFFWFGLSLFLMVFSFTVAAIFEAFIAANNQAKHPLISSTRVDEKGRLPFPHLTLCSLWFTGVGMNESWFKSVDAKFYPYFYALEPPSQDVPFEFVPAQPYGRNGSCLAIDSGNFKVSTDYDFVYVAFGFQPQYNEFCNVTAPTSNKTSVPVCLRYFDWAAYIPHEFELILTKEKGQAGTSSKGGGYRLTYIPYNDKEVTFSLSPFRTKTLNGHSEENWNMATTSSDLLNLVPIFDKGTFYLRFWITFPSTQIVVSEEVEPNVYWGLFTAITGIIGLAGFVWYQCMQEKKPPERRKPAPFTLKVIKVLSMKTKEAVEAGVIEMSNSAHRSFRSSGDNSSLSSFQLRTKSTEGTTV